MMRSSCGGQSTSQRPYQTRWEQCKILAVENIARVVRIYAKADGTVPFTHWLDKLKDIRGRQLIKARLKRVALGNLGDCKSVGEGVIELRIDWGPGYRVYFGQQGRETVILLCGGSKRTQSWDIMKAKAFWSDYRSRLDANEH